MVKKRRENRLETILRYEIILALFALIGFYYFLTFSPVRMPAQPLSTPAQPLHFQQETSPAAASGAGREKSLPAATPSQTRDGEQPSPPAADHPSSRPAVPDSPPPAAAVPEPAPAVQPPTAGSPAAARPRQQPAAKAAGAASAASGQVPDARQPQPQSSVVPGTEKPARPGNRSHAGRKNQEAKGKDAAATAPATPPTPAPRPDEKNLHRKNPGKPAAAAAAPTAPAAGAAGRHPGRGYVIQAGIFIFPDTLEHYRRLLHDHGYASFVVTRRQKERMNRVFLGPYPDRRAAAKTRDRVRTQGDEPFISRRGQSYYVNVGSFYYRAKAAARVAKYRRLGYHPRVFREPVKIRHYILLVNGFSFNHYPQDTLRKIHQLGITDAFVRPWRP